MNAFTFFVGYWLVVFSLASSLLIYRACRRLTRPRQKEQELPGVDMTQVVDEPQSRKLLFIYVCPDCGMTSDKEQPCPSDVHDVPIMMRKRVTLGDIEDASTLQRIHGGHDDQP